MFFNSNVKQVKKFQSDLQIKIHRYNLFSTTSDCSMETLRQPQSGNIFEKFLGVKNCSEQPHITKSLKAAKLWKIYHNMQIYHYLMGIKNKLYFLNFSTLKMNNSKITHQILTNLTVLETIDKTTFVEHTANILRLPLRTSRQPQ